MIDLFQKAINSLHVPFIQEVIVRLSHAGKNDEVDRLAQWVWYLTEGYKDPQTRAREIYSRSK